jgi:hypothetical protein
MNSKLPCEICALIVEFISPESVMNFALVSSEMLRAVITVYPAPNDHEWSLVEYIRALKNSLCVRCNIIYKEKGCLFDHKYDGCATCEDCNHHTNRQLMHDFEHVKDCREDVVTKCRFGCNWYCRICHITYADDVITTNSAIICACCANIYRIEGEILSVFEYTADVRHVDIHYFNAYKNTDLIQKYDPEWFGRALYACYDVRNKLYLRCDYKNDHIVLPEDTFISDYALEYVRGLFGEDEY